MTESTTIKATSWKELVATPEYNTHVEALICPQDMKHLLHRLRNVTIFVRVRGELITSENTDDTYNAYDLPEHIEVSKKHVVKLMKGYIRFNSAKAERGKPVGKIRVSRYCSCLFIG